MNLLAPLAKLLGYSPTPSPSRGLARRSIQAKYDAAGSSSDLRKLWANADSLSANAAHSPAVRKTLRERGRYECANNCYARGLVDSLANETIGVGPRAQIVIAGDNPQNAEIASEVEALFREWTEEIGLAEKMRLMVVAWGESGECFCLLTENERLLSPVKLDLKLIEADRVTAPSDSFTPNAEVDGIRYDQFGNPTAYSVLRRHPGSTASFGTEADWIDASFVLHYFRPLRPEQGRGIPGITPALPLFALLRRYTLAVVNAAEAAADIALVISNDGPPDDQSSVEAMDTFDIERGVATALPDGYKLGQVDAKQPTSTYREFKGEVITEIGRSCAVPENLVRGTSKDYNYASGRLDNQFFDRRLKIDQAQIASTILNRLFAAWLFEAVLIENHLPEALRRINAPRVSVRWLWPGRPHVDPVKDANAQAERLNNGTTTLAKECADDGEDWEEVLEQKAREKARKVKLGLEPAVVTQTAAKPALQPADADPSESGGDDA